MGPPNCFQDLKFFRNVHDLAQVTLLVDLWIFRGPRLKQKVKDGFICQVKNLEELYSVA